MSGETFDILNSIFSGQKPLRRTNPKVGESEYYYVVPGQNDWTSLNDVETVDVPSADTPNPYLQPQNTTFSQPTQFAQNNMQANDGNPKDFWNGVMNSSEQDSSPISNSQGVYSLPNIASTAYKMYKMSSPQNPLKTNNATGDFILNHFPLVKKFNQGFNIGRLGAVGQLTYEDLKRQENK